MSPYTEQLALELRRLGMAGAPVERLLAELPQGLMLVEAPSGRILFSSAQVSHILSDEIAHAGSIADSDGWEWSGLRGPDSRPLAPDEWPLARAIHRGETVTAEELLMVHTDGTRRWIRVSAAPLTASDGRVAAGVALFHDVTEQKGAEQRATALAKLAKRLGAARTAADVYRVIVDHGRRTLGAYAGGIVTPEGEGWLQFIAAVGYPERLLEEYRRFPSDAPLPAALVLRTGEPLFLTYEEWLSRFRGPATASATKAIAVLPLRVEDRTTAALTLSFDTPRRFPAAERLFMEALADHCGQALERALLYDAEREARAAAEAANRAKDEFLAMISHDLRTPLNAMAGWAAVLRQRAGDNPALADAIGAIQRSADLQVRLVDDLLDLSRAASGKLHISPEPIAPASVARSAVDAIRFAAAAKGVRVEVDVDECVLHDLVYADPARLQQMLGNLLSNAVKFTSANGVVALTVRSASRNVAFTVTDTGPGIEPALLPFVFDRFRQAASGGRDRGDGLGLGLAIVRHLIQVHGGVVYAHSRDAGTGAGFTLLLPLARPADAGRDRGPHPEPQTTLSGIEVLALLGDDAAAGIRTALESHGAAIRTVATATAACQEVERCSPAVILCDVTTAAIDGATFVRRLREAEAGSERRLPVAALMPRRLRPQQAASDLVGCNTLIPDPVDTEQLVLTVQALAGRSEEVTPLTIAARDSAGALGPASEGQFLA